MKKYSSLLKVFLIAALFYSCEKTTIEKQGQMNNVTSPVIGANDRGGEEEDQLLGSASSLGISEETDVCTPAKFRIVCLQHVCQGLKSDPVEEWSFTIYYYYVSGGNVFLGTQTVNNFNTSFGTWVNLNYPIIKTSVLHSVNTSWNHRMTGDAFDNDAGGFRIATTDIYAQFDCNYSDSDITLHKLTHWADLPSTCEYYSPIQSNASPAVKNLVIEDDCKNSSSGSSLAQSYPCFQTIGGGH